MTYENNVIELKNYRLSSLPAMRPEHSEARAARRAWRVLEKAALALEVAVSGLIGLGFLVCVGIFFTML